jgi:hypothetical protein
MLTIVIMDSGLSLREPRNDEEMNYFQSMIPLLSPSNSMPQNAPP